MIKRFNDYSLFSTTDIEKIAKAVSDKEKTTLFEVAETEEKALLAKKELRIQGYQVRIEPFGKKFKVYAILPETVSYTEAIESGQFKKLAWGRYSFQQQPTFTRESAIGMFKYDFDDGTIWRVMQGEDGKDYLVKEVADTDDEEIIRTKVASNDDMTVNDNNVKTVLKILYDNLDDNFVKDLLASNLKNQLYSLIQGKLDNVITAHVEKNRFIQSPAYIAELKGVVRTAIDKDCIKSQVQLEKLVVEHSNQYVTATGKCQKLFD